MDQQNRIFLQANITVVEISKTNDSISNTIKALNKKSVTNSVISCGESSDDSE
jgi:hypothetical protein